MSVCVGTGRCWRRRRAKGHFGQQDVNRSVNLCVFTERWQSQCLWRLQLWEAWKANRSVQACLLGQDVGGRPSVQTLANFSEGTEHPFSHPRKWTWTSLEQCRQPCCLLTPPCSDQHFPSQHPALSPLPYFSCYAFASWSLLQCAVANTTQNNPLLPQIQPACRIS